MIVANHTHAFRFLRTYWLYLASVVAISICVELVNDHVDFDRRALSPTSVGLVVTALSVFLAFRVSESYSRWWEARTLWGAILNDSRNLTRQLTTLVSDDSANVRMVHRQIAWANALRHSLRNEDDSDSLAPLLSRNDFDACLRAANHVTQLMQQQGQDIAAAQATGSLDGFGRLALEETMSRLTAHQGGCERIRNTASPDRVAFFARFTAWGLAITIPMVVLESGNDIDLIDMFVTPFLMLAFLLTERLGAELKTPFANRANGTPMTALCRTIEIDLRQQLGETDLPDPIGPEDGILM
jgi:putative membrane protein